MHYQVLEIYAELDFRNDVCLIEYLAHVIEKQRAKAKVAKNVAK